ncbi:MAG: hypothetical protein H7332_06605 [Bdellovibrionales bacterium]|nr:hypothetical protein [Ramlibacter sp.]
MMTELKFPPIQTTVRTAAALAVLALAAGQAQASPCRDPWISELAPSVWGHPVRGSGETGECNINLYGHSWSNKDQLRRQMQAAQKALTSAGIEFNPANPNMIIDIKYNARMLLEGNNVGLRGSVPNKNWMIDLPNGYVFSVQRRCPPGKVAASAGANSGCV